MGGHSDPEEQRAYDRENKAEYRELDRGVTGSAARRKKLPEITANSLADVKAAILRVMNEVRTGENLDLPRARFTINALGELRETFRVEKEIELNERLEAIEQHVALLSSGYVPPTNREETVIALPLARREQSAG